MNLDEYREEINQIVTAIDFGYQNPRAAAHDLVANLEVALEEQREEIGNAIDAEYRAVSTQGEGYLDEYERGYLTGLDLAEQIARKEDS